MPFPKRLPHRKVENSLLKKVFNNRTHKMSADFVSFMSTIQSVVSYAKSLSQLPRDAGFSALNEFIVGLCDVLATNGYAITRSLGAIERAQSDWFATEMRQKMVCLSHRIEENTIPQEFKGGERLKQVIDGFKRSNPQLIDGIPPYAESDDGNNGSNNSSDQFSDMSTEPLIDDIVL